MNQKDNIFADLKKSIPPFAFDAEVAEVFDDMIKRSVPGYDVLVGQLAVLANRVVVPNSHIYDLGSSLGAVSIAIRRELDNKAQAKDCHLFAIDNSTAMVAKCQRLMNAYHSSLAVSVQQNDIRQVDLSNASLVILNFTLQFLPVDERLNLLEKINKGMNSGGVLVLSEKLAFQDKSINDLVINLHEDFKRNQGYSELEISQKREALQDVMIPESLEVHRERLIQAGFRHVETWFQQYNFMSLLAIK